MMETQCLSVVIPTLQKNKKVLTALIDNLIVDESVSEIILVDNSLNGFDCNSEKVRVILPDTNLYVNPSWNLGVKEAKNNIVALLNDDILPQKDFCKKVVSQMTCDMGIVGVNGLTVVMIDNPENLPVESEVRLEKASCMDLGFGIAMFFNKTAYSPIPDDIKIVYGDNWIFNNCKQKGLINYRISNEQIYHVGALSSGIKTFNPICKQDGKLYKKLTVKWYDRLFSYEELWDFYKFRILGVTLKFRKKHMQGICNE